MRFDEYEYRIGTHFLSALINADLSGLTDEEEAELDAFERRAHEEHGTGGSWIVPGDDSDTDFGTCDVSDMASDTRTVVYMVPAKPATRARPKDSGICYRQSARKHRRKGHAVRFWDRDPWGHSLYRWTA